MFYVSMITIVTVGLYAQATAFERRKNSTSIKSSNHRWLQNVRYL